MKRGATLAVVPASLLLGALAARVLMNAAPARIAVDRMQPLLVVSAWGAFGGRAFALLCVAVVVAAVACAFATARHRVERGDGLALTLTLTAIGLVACAAWPFVFSSDVYAYAAYGELANRGIDPYRLAPPAQHGAILDAARWQWGGNFPPCVYGPLFVLFARAMVGASHALGATTAATLAAFRVCAALAFLASIVFAHHALERIGAQRRAAILVAYALNPVIVWSVAEGHNDIYALLAVSAAGALIAKQRIIAIAFTLPFAALLKATGAIVALAYALDYVVVQRRAAAAVAGATLAGFAITAAIVFPLLAPALGATAAHGRLHAAASVGAVTGSLVATGAACALAAIGLATLARSRRSGYAWLGLAIVTALPNNYPWYAVWLVPLALPTLGSVSSRALWVVTICALVRYLPDAYGYMAPGANLAMAAIAAAPIAFAFTSLRADLAPPHEERRSP